MEVNQEESKPEKGYEEIQMDVEEGKLMKDQNKGKYDRKARQNQDIIKQKQRNSLESIVKERNR